MAECTLLSQMQQQQQGLQWRQCSWQLPKHPLDTQQQQQQQQ
jgi:hypothetical protein